MDKSFNYQQQEAEVNSAHYTAGEDSKPRNENYLFEQKKKKKHSLRKKSFLKTI